jgi:protein TonB
MDATKILAADILDILFDGKNKDYGAYELRKNYHRRLGGAILMMVAILAVLIAGYYLSKSNTRVARTFIIPDDTLERFIKPPREIIIPHDIIRPRVQTISFTIPRIVKENQVQKNEMPPDTALAETKIGKVNQDGIKDDGPTGPQRDDHKGIVEAPKQDKKIDDFIPIENESQYPGGMDAWQRYLNKNLHYPEAAIGVGLEGDVIVQFVVDNDGNVSNVEAVSGPNELRDEAVRVIRKSGQWTPALQNGHHVRSIKKQPVKFRLDPQ